MSAPFGMYGGYKYESTESRALGSITTESYDYRDQVQFMSKMAGDVSYMASYMRKMQKGIDDANQNFVQQIQSLINDFLALLGGSGDTGFDFGDLKYIIQAFGSLFGLQPGLPLPVNLFGAAWHFFSNYIVPAGNFTELINQIIDSAIATVLDIFGEVPIVGQALQQLAQILSSLRDLIVPVFESLESFLDIFNINLGDIPSLEGFFTPLEPIFTVLKNAFNGVTGTFDNIIGSIPANIITGVINSINLPDIDAGKIIGVLSSLNLPNIDASKIIGSFPLSMITGLVDALNDIDFDLTDIFSDITDLFNFASNANIDLDQLFDWFAQAFAKFSVSNITEWLNDLFSTKGIAATAFSNAQTALTDAQQALTDLLNKLGISDFNTFLTNVFGTTTITGATKIAQDKINGLVDDLTALFGWIANADIDINQLFDWFNQALSKFGVADVAAWLNDLFSTKGIAATASGNANTALTNANQALANFTAALTKFGVGSVSAWLDDLFGTKGTANTAKSLSSTVITAGNNLVSDPLCLNDNMYQSNMYSSDVSYGGTKSIKTTGTQSKSLIVDDVGIIDIPCVPGDVFYIEMWVYGKTTNTLTAGLLYLSVVMYDAGKTWPPQYDNTPWVHANSSLNGVWTKASAYVTVPSGASYIRAYAVADSVAAGEVYYFSDCKIYRVTEAKAAETLASAAQSIANTALTDAQQALANFAAALTKFGVGSISAWLDDLFSTKGIASTASGNASTALTNANQALANFTAALTKFGVGSVSAWLDDLFGTKGKAVAANTLAFGAIRGGANLVSNAGFENSSLWVRPSFSYSTEQAHSGTQSLKSVSNAWTEQFLDESGPSPLPCTPGDVYAVEMWMYGDAGNPAANNYAQIGHCQCWDSAGNLLNTTYLGFTNSAGLDATKGVWTKVSDTITIPANAAKFQVTGPIINATNVTMYWDDFAVYRITEASAAQTLANAAQAIGNTALADAQKAISDAAAIVLKLFGGAAMGSNILESLIPALTVGKIPQLDQSKITNLVNDLGAKLAAGTFNTFLTNVFGTTNVTNATKIAQDKINGLATDLAALLKTSDWNTFLTNVFGTTTVTGSTTIAQAKIAGLVTDLGAKLATTAFNTFLTNVFGTTTITSATKIAQDKINGLVTDLSALTSDIAARLSASVFNTFLTNVFGTTNVTGATTIAQSKITGLATSLAALLKTSDWNTFLNNVFGTTTITSGTTIAQAKIAGLVNDLGAKLAASAFNTFLTNVFGTTTITSATTIAQEKVTNLVSGLGTAAANALSALTNAATADAKAGVAQSVADVALLSGSNMATNPGFENSNLFINYNGTNRRYSTEQAHSGTQSLKLTGYTWTELFASTTEYLYQPCNPGDRFYAEIWILGHASNVPITTYYAYLQATFKDASGAWLSGAWNMSGWTVANFPTWTKLSGYVTAPANAAFITVQNVQLGSSAVSPERDNTYYWDDFKCYRITEAYEAQTDADAARATANTALADAATALADLANKLTASVFNTFLNNVFGTTNVTSGTQIAQAKISGLVTDLGAKLAATSFNTFLTNVFGTTNVTNATTIAQSKIANLATDLAALLKLTDWNTFLTNIFGTTTISGSTTIAQAKISGLVTDLGAKLAAASFNTFLTNVFGTTNVTNTTKLAQDKIANLVTDLSTITTNIANKLGLTDWNTFLTNIFGTTTITGSTTIAQAKIAGLVADLGARLTTTIYNTFLNNVFGTTNVTSATTIAQAKITGLVAGLGTATSNANTALADAGTAITNIVNTWQNLFGSSTLGSIIKTEVVPKLSADKVSGLPTGYPVDEVLAAHAAEIANLKSDREVTNNGGKTIKVNFKDYPNASSLPTTGEQRWSTTYSGSGTATFGTNGGKAAWIGSTSGSRTAKVIYLGNGTAGSEKTLTDYQVLRGVLEDVPLNQEFTAMARVADDGNSYVWAKAIATLGFLTVNVTGAIGCVVNGTSYTWVQNIPLTWSTEMQLKCGVDGDPYKFQVFSGTTLVVNYTDTAKQSRVGEAYRRFGAIAKCGNTATSGTISTVTVSDNPPVVYSGSVARMSRLSTAGAGTMDTTERALPASFFDQADFESLDIDGNLTNGTFLVTRSKMYIVSARIKLRQAFDANGNVNLQLSSNAGINWNTVQMGPTVWGADTGIGAIGPSSGFVLAATWLQYLNEGDLIRLSTVADRNSRTTAHMGGVNGETYFTISALG